MTDKVLSIEKARVVEKPFVHAARMSDKVLSVKEAAEILRKNILDACFDSEDIEQLISAVRREERDKLICSECGFPPELQREPIFLDNNSLSFLKYRDNACEKCGCQKDGSTIPVVAKKIREVVEHIQKRERERAVKIIDSTLKIPFENYLDVQAVKKKILKESEIEEQQEKDEHECKLMDEAGELWKKKQRLK